MIPSRSFLILAALVALGSPAGAAPDASGGKDDLRARAEVLKAEAAAKEAVREVFSKEPPAKTGYCNTIADAAADARFAWQKDQLAALEKQVEERIKALEAKRAEYEGWLTKRNEFLAKADESVVAVYAKMRPDAAALQLANMPDEPAAAILTKLNARVTSAILSEMEAARAAQLARKMNDAGRKAKDAAAPETQPRPREKS